MPITVVFQQCKLRLLKSLGLVQQWVGEMLIKTFDQYLRRLIVDEPEGRERAARPGLDGDTGETESGPVIAGRRLAGAERQQFDWFMAKFTEFYKSLQVIHGQPSIESQQEAVAGVVLEFPMGCDVDNGIGC